MYNERCYVGIGLCKKLWYVANDGIRWLQQTTKATYGERTRPARATLGPSALYANAGTSHLTLDYWFSYLWRLGTFSLGGEAIVIIGLPVMLFRGRLATLWLCRPYTLHFPYIRDGPVTVAKRQRSVLRSPTPYSRLIYYTLLHSPTVARYERPTYNRTLQI